MEGRIANRKGRVYLDPYRNGFGQTVVSPYSVRRRPKAPFSLPLDWSEVGPGLDPTEFNLGNAAKWLARPDPWKDFWRKRQAFARAHQAVKSLRPAATVIDASEISSARDYYRKILPFYEKESLLRAHLDFWRRIARESRPRRILEIGAGFGRITAALSRVAPAVGIDVSLEMLTAAQPGAGGAARPSWPPTPGA